MLLHSPNIASILNRKDVTKQLLFGYLHSKKVPVRGDASKFALLQELFAFWDTQNSKLPNSQTVTVGPSTIANKSNYPIARLASEFVKWFWKSYSDMCLGPSDFWTDVEFLYEFVQNSGLSVRKEEGIGATTIVNALTAMHRETYIFNVKYDGNGIQGNSLNNFLAKLTSKIHSIVARMDEANGLVIILCTGTVTILARSGNFQSLFGLVRESSDGYA